ncbi:uncharacterized protein BP5553_00290 [Venustampulla echinocandica]|uniref:HMG box domain-containing protein n=1 Tax=Venustampulla echinocandica TaxID=2656787 RepID=A0A370TXR3_9HELO|nr:uncharacterized protein BP5553_00290 [Venustampulla echinocandica]RDL40311.1 hypothetical protein BP5553_00290 [Venustampulla echinocandica]
MSDVLELPRSNLGTPRSSTSSVTDPSRRTPLKLQHVEKGSESRLPGPPQTRLTKRRAASLDLDGTNHPKIEDLALDSPNKHPRGEDPAPSSASTVPSSATPTREQVCLCQPDPKIPRPRNAFILYRQHYQAQVIAQHPGLANPEISKIIGEQWREQAPEVKNEWKRLADEEKQRHQRQYPGYRYQPRRAGKPTSLHPISSSTSDDPERCPKCNGRYISTPSAPPTPLGGFSAVGSVRKGRLLPPFTPSRATEPDRSPYPSRAENTKMDSPRTASVHLPAHRRGPYPRPSPLHAHNEMDEEMDLLSPPPDQKRRRFNQESHRYNNELPHGYVSSSPVYYNAPPPRFSRNMPPPASAGGYRPQQLPGPGMIARGGTMGPPAQYSPMNQQRQHYPPQLTPPFDESLRLPPLQTQLSKPAVVAPKRPNVRTDSRDSRAKSVEAMVMTIPYVNKIRVLAKISPPFACPSPASPAIDMRGAVIAIEGADNELLSETGAFIQEHLGNDTSCAVKTWDTPACASRSSRNSSLTDSDMRDASASTPAPIAMAEDQNAFMEYLSTIREWHRRSQGIIKHITTAPAKSAEDSSSNASSGTNNTNVFPIALVPGGFSLTTSDDFALRIPINDSYAPVDHWQWMATLWRGIVGPDLTVYVTRVGREEMNKFGGVEIRNDCSAIIVRVCEGAKMDEKTARRLGFEVMEFVRGLESGFGKE